MKWRVALKYLFSPKSHSVINIIATVSIVAVMVPVAAMVILLSVFNGLEGVLHEMNRATEADIEVRVTGDGRIGLDEPLRHAISSAKGVEAVSFVAERQVLLKHRDRQLVATVRGVDEAYENIVPWRRHLTFGSADTAIGDIDRLVVGEGLAHGLGIIAVLSEVQITSMGAVDVGAILPTAATRTTTLNVGGGFMIDGRQDRTLALTSLRAAQQMFGLGDNASTAFVKVADGYSHEEVCRNIEAQDKALTATSREERNAAFYAIMRYEKWAVFFVSLLVLIIASLSIIGTVVMLIVEKRDEQRTFYALGADSRFMRGVFLREGVLIAAIGGLIGVVLGIALVLVQQHFGILKLPNENFLIRHYPVELRAMDIVVIVITLVAVTLAVSHIATRTMIKSKSLCETK